MENILKNLTIADNFIFQEVMKNKEICKEFLEKLLNITITELVYNENEKSMKNSSVGKGTRLDLFVKSSEGIAFNLEMETVEGKKSNLPKRTRYYQAMIDSNSLMKGEKYKNLKPAYIIFICTFDPFNKGAKVYSFDMVCKEYSKLKLDDEVTRIFLNASGNKGKVNRDISRFLRYLNKRKVEGDFVKKIDAEVEKAKNNERLSVEYMKYWADREDLEDEAEARGVFLSLKKVMKKLKLSIDDAMDWMEIPLNEREIYKAKLAAEL